MNVKIKLIENGKLPVKGSEHAACFDCFVRKIDHLPDGMVICSLGFATEIPEGYKGVIVSRSNITKYGWVLANGIGIVDSDYRNEWQARFRPIPEQLNHIVGEGYFNSPFPYKINERVCQIYFEKVNEFTFNVVDDLGDTIRGLGGFGSTGKS